MFFLGLLLGSVLILLSSMGIDRTAHILAIVANLEQLFLICLENELLLLAVLSGSLYCDDLVALKSLYRLL